MRLAFHTCLRDILNLIMVRSLQSVMLPLSSNAASSWAVVGNAFKISARRSASSWKQVLKYHHSSDIAAKMLIDLCKYGKLAAPR